MRDSQAQARVQRKTPSAQQGRQVPHECSTGAQGALSVDKSQGATTIMRFGEKVCQAHPALPATEREGPAKRQRVSDHGAASVIRDPTFPLSKLGSEEWGRRLAALVDGVWKVETLAHLLPKSPPSEAPLLRERLGFNDGGKNAEGHPYFAPPLPPTDASLIARAEGLVASVSGKLGTQITSDEVLAANLVLDTLSCLPREAPRGFSKLSEATQPAPWLSLMLQRVYGGLFCLSVADTERGEALRNAMFGGTHEQVRASVHERSDGRHGSFLSLPTG